MDKNVAKEIWQEYKGKIFKFQIGVLAKNVETDDAHRFVTKEQAQKIDKQEKERIVEFSEAKARENIASGETLGTIFGKIKKVIKDLGAAAWCGTTDSVTSGTDKDVVTRKALKVIDEKTGDMSLKREGSNIYVEYKDGADTVRKKLGNGVGIVTGFLRYESLRSTKDSNVAWGTMSVFDLSWIPGYQEFVFGENVFCVPVNTGAGQEHMGFYVYAQLMLQFNYDHNLDTPYRPDKVTISNISKMIETYGKLSTHGNRVQGLPVACHVGHTLENANAKVADLPSGILQTSVYSQCAAYDPLSGRLYYHVNDIAHCDAVAIFKADIEKVTGTYSISGSEEKYECVYASPCW